MKKHFIMAFAAIAVLASCSDNDTQSMDVNPGESPMALNKTITYFPALENFETRNVKYYDNNINIVADSIYDANNNFMSRNIYTVNGNTLTITTKNGAGATTAVVTEQHDEQGRLTDYNNNGVLYQYTYDADSVSEKKWDEAAQAFVEMAVFTYNSNGYLYAQTELVGDIISDATSLVFTGNQPTALMAQGVTGQLEQLGAYTYYSNSVPSALQKSVIAINNEVLKANKIEDLAVLSNNYLQDFTLGSSPYYHSDITFSQESGLSNYPYIQNVMLQGEQFCTTYYFFAN